MRFTTFRARPGGGALPKPSNYTERMYKHLASLRSARVPKAPTDLQPRSGSSDHSAVDSSARDVIARLDDPEHCFPVAYRDGETTIDRPSDASDATATPPPQLKWSPLVLLQSSAWGRETRTRLHETAVRLRSACAATRSHLLKRVWRVHAPSPSNRYVSPSPSSPSSSSSAASSPRHRRRAFSAKDQRALDAARESVISIRMSYFSSRSLSDPVVAEPERHRSPSEDDSDRESSHAARRDAALQMQSSATDLFRRRCSSASSYASESDPHMYTMNRSSALSDCDDARCSLVDSSSDDGSESDDDESYATHVRDSLFELPDGTTVWVRSQWI